MAVVRLGPNGEVEVLVPPAPEEVVEAKAAVEQLIVALARVAEERDWAERQRQEAGLSGSEPHVDEAVSRKAKLLLGARAVDRQNAETATGELDMAVGASSYYDLPYDDLYGASRIQIALTHGVSYPSDELDHPDELGVFEGRLVSYQASSDYPEIELAVRLPVRLCTYRSWSSALPEFEKSPSAGLGTVALGIGRYDEGHYNCRVAVRDESEAQTQRLLTALLATGLAGEREVMIVLSGRRDLPPQGQLRSDPSVSADEPCSFIDNYAWEECGVDPNEFGEALDAHEHEPPLAHFEAIRFQIEVNVHQIARMAKPRPPSAKAKPRTM